MPRRLAVIALLTLVAIAIHELGHYLVYRIAGYPVVVTLQSVRPAATVPVTLDHWAKAAGPAVSVLVAAVLLGACRRRPTFGWATGSFTNATLRLFPLVMDMSRAAKGKGPFSDEGEIAVALMGQGAAGRLGFLCCVIAVCLVLAVLAAREYHFRSRSALKTLGVYFTSLLVGMAVVLVDEATR